GGDRGCCGAVIPASRAQLALARGDAASPRLFRWLTKVDLLILDDLGPDRLNASQRRDLLEIVEDRHDRSSTLIASQLPIKAWHDLIGEPTYADAILDRLVHNAYRLELEGERSMGETVPDSHAQAPSPAPTASNPPKTAKGTRK